MAAWNLIVFRAFMLFNRQCNTGEKARLCCQRCGMLGNKLLQLFGKKHQPIRAPDRQWPVGMQRSKWHQGQEERDRQVCRAVCEIPALKRRLQGRTTSLHLTFSDGSSLSLYRRVMGSQYFTFGTVTEDHKSLQALIRCPPQIYCMCGYIQNTITG